MKWAALLLLALGYLAAYWRSPPAPVDISAYVGNIRAAQRDTGAIAMTPGGETIEPYFANLAAKALLRADGQLDAVQRYLDWYLAHINPDGTISDFRMQGGQEVATGDADSTDAYAATFLSLVTAWVEAGGDREWVHRHRAQLDLVADAIVQVTDGDGLTWSSRRASYKLLMDNCEVYQGWVDWSRLLYILGDRTTGDAAASRAVRLRKGLTRFIQGHALWGWGIDRAGLLHQSDMSRFYPDAVAQLFPLITGVTSSKAGYRAFSAGQPTWPTLTAGDFPWLLPTYAAAISGDTVQMRQAITSAGANYADFRWPWFVGESAWLIDAASTAHLLPVH